MLLDVRTFSRHSNSRIRSAVKIGIPNALLKRPSFTIDKIRDTLSSKRDRSILRERSSYANIIIYDANSVTPNDAGVISYVARKFRRENCTAELGWLCGGFDNFSRNHPELCEPSSPPDPNSAKLLLSSSLNNSSCENIPSKVFPPIIANEFGDEQPAKRKPPLHIRFDVPTGPLTCPISSTTVGSEGAGDNSKPSAESSRKENEGKFACRPQTTHSAAKPLASSNRDLQLSSMVSPSVGETVAIRLPPCITNDEEASGEGSVEDSTLTLQSTSGPFARSENCGQYFREPRSKSPELQVLNHREHLEAEMNAHHVPQFLKELAIGPDAEQKIAKIFQTIDKTEQRRLQSLMLHHARYPTTDHPFSISAGVERGEKNRYVNIWPYDYTRVHLGRKTPPVGGVQKNGDDSDYVNASFIKAPHCDQTYVATQGPLPTTFNDFWNVVWNKEIKVIVMLTREEEGGRLKCHRYWPDEKNLTMNYGPAVSVELLDKETLPEGDGSIIRRHFRMRYIPSGATRIIVQLQYIGWPDCGVPDTPLAVLQLRMAVLAGPRIHEQSTENKSQSPQDRTSTILVHCSAGCGRTGAFCTIDSTLRLLERLDGPFGCSNEAAIADDVAMAKHEAEIEAQNQAEAEREEAKQLPAFATGNFSVAAALKPEPTPDTFCLKMPKILKGKRRGAAVGPSEGTQAANNDLPDKPLPDTPLKNQTASPTTTCSQSESKLTSQPANNNSCPPFSSSVQVAHKMGPPAQFKPLPYPNLLPSAESRCTRDVVRGCVEVFREQRLSMVQTLRQFVFCYEAVLWQLMGMADQAVCKTQVEHGDNVACCGEESRLPESPTGNRKPNLTEVEHMASPVADIRVDSLQLKKIRKRKRNEQLSKDSYRRDKEACSSNSSSTCTSTLVGCLEMRNLVNEAPSSSYFPIDSLPTYQSPSLSKGRSFIKSSERSDLQQPAASYFRFNSSEPSVGTPRTSGERNSEEDKKHVKIDTVDGAESKFAGTRFSQFHRACSLEGGIS